MANPTSNLRKIMPQIEFTAEQLKLMKCQVMDQEIVPDKFDDSELPTDVHIVEYMVGDEKFFDVVRAYTMVDIFDPYYDKLKGVDGHILSIKNGYGRIKPKLYGKIQN